MRGVECAEPSSDLGDLMPDILIFEGRLSKSSSRLFHLGFLSPFRNMREEV